MIISDTAADITAAANQRILVLDGTMGTMIQAEKPTQETYRGNRFADHRSDPAGNNELLTLTQPDMIEATHMDFLNAGADILLTNTFSATRISQADFGLEHLWHELNVQGSPHRPPCRRQGRDARLFPLGRKRHRTNQSDRVDQPGLMPPAYPAGLAAVSSVMKSQSALSETCRRTSS